MASQSLTSVIRSDPTTKWPKRKNIVSFVISSDDHNCSRLYAPTSKLPLIPLSGCEAHILVPTHTCARYPFFIPLFGGGGCMGRGMRQPVRCSHAICSVEPWICKLFFVMVVLCKERPPNCHDSETYLALTTGTSSEMLYSRSLLTWSHQ